MRALRATVLVPAEFREIVSGSQIIVYGRITDVHAEWSDDRRRIDTVVTLDGGAYLKGGPGAVVTFSVPGGQIGRYSNVMVGAPNFSRRRGRAVPEGAGPVGRRTSSD